MADVGEEVRLEISAGDKTAEGNCEGSLSDELLYLEGTQLNDKIHKCSNLELKQIIVELKQNQAYLLSRLREKDDDMASLTQTITNIKKGQNIDVKRNTQIRNTYSLIPRVDEVDLFTINGTNNLGNEQSSALSVDKNINFVKENNVTFHRLDGNSLEKLNTVPSPLAPIINHSSQNQRKSDINELLTHIPISSINELATVGMKRKGLADSQWNDLIDYYNRVHPNYSLNYGEIYIPPLAEIPRNKDLSAQFGRLNVESTVENIKFCLDNQNKNNHNSQIYNIFACTGAIPKNRSGENFESQNKQAFQNNVPIDNNASQYHKLNDPQNMLQSSGISFVRYAEPRPFTLTDDQDYIEYLKYLQDYLPKATGERITKDSAKRILVSYLDQSILNKINPHLHVLNHEGIIKHVSTLQKEERRNRKQRYIEEFNKLEPIDSQPLVLFADVVQNAAIRAFPDFALGSESLDLIMINKLINSNYDSLTIASIRQVALTECTIIDIAPTWVHYYKACIKLDAANIPVLVMPSTYANVTKRNNVLRNKQDSTNEIIQSSTVAREPGVKDLNMGITYRSAPGNYEGPFHVEHETRKKSLVNLSYSDQYRHKRNLLTREQPIRYSLFHKYSISFPCNNCRSRNHNAYHCTELDNVREMERKTLNY